MLTAVLVAFPAGVVTGALLALWRLRAALRRERETSEWRRRLLCRGLPEDAQGDWRDAVPAWSPRAGG